jgi:uncharacterized DUF497 family protein
MGLTFEWDEKKAVANLKKHGVSFLEATTAFGDPLSITIPDAVHSKYEERFILIGQSKMGRLLVVAHCDKINKIRIISAREAIRRERETYEEKY